MTTIPCSCGRADRHLPTCLVAQAFRTRCPDCKSLKRDGYVRHAHHCPLKEYKQP